LHLLKTIEVAPFVGMAWFPDNRRIAVASSGIHVVDTVDGTVSPPLTDSGGLLLEVSPDGRYLAAIQIGGFTIFSTGNWQKIIEYRAKKDECAFTYDSGLIFASDSQSIWIGCAGRGVPGAVRLSLPNLHIVDRVEIAPLISAHETTSFVHVQSDLPVLHVITVEYSESAQGSSAASLPVTKFGRVVDLASKTDILPTMEFARSDWPTGHPGNVYLSRDRKFYLDYSGLRVPGGGVVTFEVATQKKVAAFDPTSISDSQEDAAPRGRWTLSNLAILRGGLAIAATVSGEPGPGALMLWDYLSGRRLAQAPGPMVLTPIRLSFNEARVATARDGKIYIYAVSR
jgi:hypothetical protein